MNQPSAQQFGLIVAYLIPGFVGLAGLAPLMPVVAQWLRPVHDGVWGFGPPVYTLLAAITISQILNCFRWVLIDQIHSQTGLKSTGDFSQLQKSIEGFDSLVQNHYRYYQFAANMLLAVLWSYSINRFLRTSPILGLGTDLGVVILVLVLFAASRDALAKYYQRTHSLLGEVAEKGGRTMYNGAGHHEGAGEPSKKVIPETKPKAKTALPPKPSTETGPKDQPSK